MNDNVAGEMSLESVIATAQLGQRSRRSPAPDAESQAILQLVEDLARSPRDIFQKLVQAILDLCRAESAGISLLDEEQSQFYWPAVSGRWHHYVGDGTPRDFGPCGAVLDRNATLLLLRPERHFAYLTTAVPRIEECLLVPFHIDGHAVGTVWAISHDPGKQFDSEDAKVLESLSSFTSLAYRTLVESGVLSAMHWARSQRGDAIQPGAIRGWV